MSCEVERNLMLAETESLGSVSLCACGTLHVSVGAVTMRMAPEAFSQMLRMCQSAADQMLIHSIQAQQPMSSRPH